VNEDLRWTRRVADESKEDLLDMGSLKEERRETALCLLLLSATLLTSPLLRMMVSRGDSTPVSAADDAQEARPCAPGTLLIASARIFLALLMLPRMPDGATGCSSAGLGVRGPSKPKAEIALMMLHELLLL
jgi:hypothetical protein